VLTPRSEKILRSIVEQYINSLAPVSSQSVLPHSHLDVSPATVRNEMVFLEENGYIIRPHTSAGAVPADKGYRYYVESLIDLQLSPVEQRTITHLFHQVERDTEEWLHLAASIISQIAQNVAIVTRPKTSGSRLKHLEIVSIRDNLALIIMVLHGAKVKQQLLEFTEPVTQAELSTTSIKLNGAYDNLTADGIQAKTIELSPAEQSVVDGMVKIMQTEDEQQYSDPYLDGLHFIVGQPEFARNQRLQALLEILERGSLLSAIVPPGLSTQEVRVVIGGENSAEAVRDCSVIISRYGSSRQAQGTIGVVGPTRMPYARTIPAVGYMAKILSRLVAGLYELPKEE
jgi:heat-inducible transcriptional repressor